MNRTFWMFPGQGAQASGIGRLIEKAYPQVRSWWLQWEQAIQEPVTDLLCEYDDQKLSLTRYTQPHLWAASVTLGMLLKEKGYQPEALAGHSVGELSALTLAGVVSPEEGLWLVVQRAQLMNEVLEPFVGGLVAVVGPDVEQVLQVISRWNENHPQQQVFAANFNGPDQLILAGLKDSLKAFETHVESFWQQCFGNKPAKLRLIGLNVSAPFHSPLMEPGLGRWEKIVKSISFKKPQYPIFTNVSGSPVTDPEVLKEHLIGQFVGQVLWYPTMQKAVEQGFQEFWEVGPGQVLARLLKRSPLGQQVQVRPVFEVLGISTIQGE